MREDDMDYEDVLQEDVLQKAHQKLSELKAGVLFINQVAKKYSWRCLWWKKN